MTRAGAAGEEDGSRPLERNETRDQVRHTLTSLPERHQLVLEWKYSERLSVREIAQRLDATEKSVEAALYRARREFRRQYETREQQGERPPAQRTAAGRRPLDEPHDSGTTEAGAVAER